MNGEHATGNRNSQERLRKIAHERLDRLLDEAETSNLHGRVGIETTVENGRFTTVRRKLEATDK
jgi:hypothetical protein